MTLAYTMMDLHRRKAFLINFLR